MQKLLLIKHASPYVIPGTPTEEWKLSDKGRESCTPLAEKLREHQPSIIYASEEPKARETAELLAEKLNVPVQTAADLHEHDRSNVPHMRSGEFISHMELFFRRPDENVLGRESADEALGRFETAIDEIIAQHPTGNIAIVSHGTVIALFLAKHTDRRPFDLWREMGLPSFAVLSLPDMKLESLVARL
jgi:broad specificity phosphatase PhoE